MKRIIALIIALSALSSGCDILQPDPSGPDGPDGPSGGGGLSISISQQTAEIVVGETVQLAATVLPPGTSETVMWFSSKNSVATVSDGGLVTALAEGKTTITVSAGTQCDVCVVTVGKAPVKVESVLVDHSSVRMYIGDQLTLNATVLPEDATDKTVKWESSDDTVATVDSDGTIEAKGKGSAVISAIAGEKSASCTVTVAGEAVQVSSVTLDRRSVSLEIGQSTTLVANVSPEEAADRTVIWVSSDTAVATVDNDGKVTALMIGEASIKASCGGKSATCVVTVMESVIPVSSVTLDHSELILEKGQRAKLTATVLPENATDRNVNWSSSDATVAYVDKDGNVTAFKGGTATIYATAGEKSATCVVTVFVPVVSIGLDKYTLSLTVGESAAIVASLNPSDATENTIKWETSDASVATVDASGKVLAVKKGSAKITASAGGKSASCAVTVRNVLFAVSPTATVIPGKGGSFEVKVSSSIAYSIGSKPEWVSETSSSNLAHTFSVAANGQQAERSGEIVFIDAEGTSVTCKVRQMGGGEFSLNPASLEVNGAGGVFEVSVTCSTGYRIDSKPDWITELTEGTIPQTHKFQAARNATGQIRSGAIVFIDDKGVRLTCTVSQESRQDGATGGNEDVPDGNPINW